MSEEKPKQTREERIDELERRLFAHFAWTQIGHTRGKEIARAIRELIEAIIGEEKP